MSAVRFDSAYAALRERFELEHGDPARQLVADVTGQPIAEHRVVPGLVRLEDRPSWGRLLPVAAAALRG